MAKKTAIAITQSGIAERCGVTRGRVSQICNSDGWAFGSGPWSPSQADAVCAAILAQRSDDGTAGLSLEKKAKITLMSKRISLLEFEIKRLHKEYIKSDDHKTAMMQHARAVCAWLDRLPNIAPEVSGASPDRARVVLAEFVREMRTALASDEPGTLDE